MARICFFHTVGKLTGRFDDLAAEYVPEADHYHSVDESVLTDMLAAGTLTPSVTARICTQLQLAERAGADLVLATCSSTSPAIDVARELVSVPILKIDDPMAERAVELGGRIAVLATAESTLEPSTALVETKATDSERSVTIDRRHVADAFEAHVNGNRDRHDRLVADAAREVTADADVLVLAQASMSHLEPTLSDELSVPVLTSPDLAMKRVTESIENAT